MKTKARIVLTNTWHGHRRLFQPGVYAVPDDLSAIEARCCVADGAGKITMEAANDAGPFRDPATKQPAPENKGRGAVPENKSPLVPVHRCGERAESNA